MTNQELFNWFKTLSKSNTFDIVTQLKDKKNIRMYKRSVFYKDTKMNIQKAYKLFLLEPCKNIINFCNTDLFVHLSEGDYAYLVIALETFIETFDPAVLSNFLDYIVEKLENVDFSNLQNILSDSVKELSLVTGPLHK